MSLAQGPPQQREGDDAELEDGRLDAELRRTSEQIQSLLARELARVEAATGATTSTSTSLTTTVAASAKEAADATEAALVALSLVESLVALEELCAEVEQHAQSRNLESAVPSAVPSLRAATATWKGAAPARQRLRSFQGPDLQRLRKLVRAGDERLSRATSTLRAALVARMRVTLTTNGWPPQLASGEGETSQSSLEETFVSFFRRLDKTELATIQWCYAWLVAAQSAALADVDSDGGNDDWAASVIVKPIEERLEALFADEGSPAAAVDRIDWPLEMGKRVASALSRVGAPNEPLTATLGDESAGSVPPSVALVRLAARAVCNVVTRHHIRALVERGDGALWLAAADECAAFDRHVAELLCTSHPSGEDVMEYTLSQLRCGGVDAADTASQLVHAHGVGITESALAQNGAAFEAWVSAEVRDAVARLGDAMKESKAAWEVTFAQIARECCDRATCLATPEHRAAMLNKSLDALCSAFHKQLKAKSGADSAPLVLAATRGAEAALLELSASAPALVYN